MVTFMARATFDDGRMVEWRPADPDTFELSEEVTGIEVTPGAKVMFISTADRPEPLRKRLTVGEVVSTWHPVGHLTDEQRRIASLEAENAELRRMTGGFR